MHRARQPLAQAHYCFQLCLLRGNCEGRSALDQVGIVEGEMVGPLRSVHSGEQLIEVEQVSDHRFGPFAFQGRAAGVLRMDQRPHGDSIRKKFIDYRASGPARRAGHENLWVFHWEPAD
jgi:hypothetical protein